MRRSTMACGLLLAFAGLLTATATGTSRAAHRSAASERAVAFYTSEIRRHRNTTWYWQRVTGAHLSPALGRPLAVQSPSQLRHVDAIWRRREKAALRRAQNPPHRQAWLCIHRYEGSWTDAGEPYYGGLQMSLSFQHAYGGWLLRHKGTADHWTPLEQIWTAEKARRAHGFFPWPNTARSCGLF